MENKKNIIKFILIIGDIFLMYASLLLVLALRYKDFSFFPGPETRNFLSIFSLIFLIWLFMLFILDFYEVPPFKKVYDFFYSLILFLILASAVGVSYFYLQPSLKITPKTILFLDVLTFGFLIFIWRIVIKYFLKIKKIKEKIAIVGFRPELKELLLNSIPQNGYEIMVFLSQNSSSELNQFAEFAKFGEISDLHKFKKIVEEEDINFIVFAADPRKDKKLIQDIFVILPLKLKYISFGSFYEEMAKKIPLNIIDEAWFLENISRPEYRINRIIKRFFDILFSTIGIIITSIIFPFIALAIKLDSSGPVLYKQERIGKDGKEFILYKFRTMINNLKQDEEVWREKDPRQITRVGRFLREVHLDEFPQFWNILKGDLSFVGPRPEWTKLAEIFEKEIPFYRQRYLILPGFTGWAQLYYPASNSVEEAKEKFQYDLYYIKNYSLILDLAIILKTLRIVFFKAGS